MIIIDQLNHFAHLYEIQVTVIYSRAILVTVTSEFRVKRVICKTGLGHWQTVQIQIRHRRMWRLIRVFTAYLKNTESLGLNETVFSTRSGPFSWSAFRDNLPTSAVSALILIAKENKYLGTFEGNCLISK